MPLSFFELFAEHFGRPTRKVLGGIVAGTALAFFCTNSLGAEIQIRRSRTGEKATTGKLFLDGVLVCATFELPNRVPFKWLVPAKYPAFIRTDGERGWRIELKDTAPLTNIQIHTGNTQEHTQSCTLVGLKADADAGFIGESAKAIKLLQAAVERSLDKSLTVEFIDPSIP